MNTDKGSSGFRLWQSAEMEAKYGDAIRACSDISFLHMNISQIAREYKVSPTGLSNQLRFHFPDVLPLREEYRSFLGMASHVPKGARAQSVQKYAQAIQLLRDTDMSLVDVAHECRVGQAGLRAYVLSYHKDIAEAREQRRQKGYSKTLHPGERNGFGKVTAPRPETEVKYTPALQLYRTTSLTIFEIARQCGVNESGFRQYLYRWHMADVESRGSRSDYQPETKAYNLSALERYGPAIRMIRDGADISQAARATLGIEYRINIRDYLRSHEPQLYRSLKSRGRVPMPGTDSTCSAKQWERYGDAVQEYLQTSHSVYSIAKTRGIQLSSLTCFLRRHYGDYERKK